MAESTSTLPSAKLTDQPALMVLAALTVVTAVRVALLFVSRIELYPDEAQYWLWSRRLDFGYFSKPPMIAWLIRATTAIGGDGEAWVRLSSPFMHAGAALALFAAGRRLYDVRTGCWAAAVYTLLTGVQLSSFVMSTDAPLMFWVSVSLWAYAAFWAEQRPDRRWLAALGLGLAVGAGVLTKYAALYVPVGVALHAALSADARRRWSVASLAVAVAGALAIASPNLMWNAAHHFQTVAHTADNADLGDERAGLRGLFGGRGPFGFILGQFGVFGPGLFAVALVAAWRALRRRTPAEDLLLVCLAAPAFVIVLAEAVIARANANWAVAGYPAGAMLAAAALARWTKAEITLPVVGFQALVAVGFFAGMAIPGAPDGVGASAAFKRARGWGESAHAVVDVALRQARQEPLSAIAVDDRFLFNALSYYARSADGRPAGMLPAPLKAWIHLRRAANQAEAEAPLMPADGGRVLAVSGSSDYLRAFRADFDTVTPVTPPAIVTRLDRKHTRQLDLFIGSGYRRRPRDPVTDQPILP